MTSAYQIAKYWLINQDRERRLMIVDLGEPSCFACQWWNEDGITGTASAWNFENSGLERAHIVPRALGGSDHPSNLVMLCVTCHADAPDVADRNVMLDWIANRRMFMLNGIPDMSNERDFHIAVKLAEDNDVDWARVREIQRELIADAGTHGARFSAGTVAYISRRSVEMAIAESAPEHGVTLMSWVPCA